MFSRSSLIILLVVLVAGCLAGCSGEGGPIQIVAVHAENPEARQETLTEMRAAWRTREVLAGAPGQRAEQRFLTHLSGAVRRFKDTESYGDICRLWNECLRDHLARFPESAS